MTDLSHSMLLDPDEGSVAETRSLVGRRVVDVRPATEEEMTLGGWKNAPVIVVFDDGTKLYAAPPAPLSLLVPDDQGEIVVWRREVVSP